MKNAIPYLAIAMSVVFYLFPIESTANNITVSSVSLTARNKTADYVQVQFNLSWENSFRVNTGPSNWDAAWVFIKYKVGVNGDWKHASISNTGGHSIPSGAITSQADTKGLFIYRDANGTGTFSLTGIQLRWNYGADGVGDDENIYVKVFAIEMVLVPQENFQVGSGGQNTGEFRQANDVSSSGTATTFTITSTAPTLQGNNTSSSAANLSTRLGVGNDLASGITTATLGTGFPTGYGPFYCMKYEISQGQYRDFLNMLTYTQQVNRTASAPNSAIGTGALISSGTARNGIEIKTPGTANTTPAVYGCDLSNNNTFDEVSDGEWIACNYLSWNDITAYLDWAALRPLTELEYEKVCRGSVTPVVNEYAWGTATATSLANLLNTSQSSEASNTFEANLVSNSAFSAGPVRVGIFATASSSRIQAGSGYYGIMELSGNLWEQTVPVSNANARGFSNIMGDGALASNGNADVSTWPTAGDVGIRGGSYSSSGTLNYLSDRTNISSGVTNRNNNIGGRGARKITIAKIEAVVIGGGGSGSVGDGNVYGSGGGGGGLAFSNWLSIESENLSVVVGSGGAAVTASVRTDGNSGGTSTLSRGATVLLSGGGGGGGIYNDFASGGTSSGTARVSGGSGGRGGQGYWTAGGGGAGGYTGNGGDGQRASGPGTLGVGGAGGGGGSGNSGSTVGGGGGGVGIFGEGASGAAGGFGGSGGTNGGTPTAGVYGGGGGGISTSGTTGAGGAGVVVIRYKTDGSDGVNASATTGGTKTTSGIYTIHTFTASGTFVCVLSYQ